jgi:hypothetical protein
VRGGIALGNSLRIHMAQGSRPQYVMGVTRHRQPRRALARRERDELIVRAPRFPPLPHSAAVDRPKVIYLTCQEATDIPESVIASLRKLNPGYDVQTFGDLECLQYLEEYWFPEHIRFFHSIPDGPIRADFWRACIMYTHGGCYIDADARMTRAIETFVLEEADVCTSGSHMTSDSHRQLNPMLIVARPRTRLMARCVGHMLATAKQAYSYWRSSITHALVRTVDDEMAKEVPTNTEGVYVTEEGEKLQLLVESEPSDSASIEERRASRVTTWRGKVVAKNHDVALYDNDAHAFRSTMGASAEHGRQAAR